MCPPVLLKAVKPREILGWGGVGSQGWLSTHPKASVQEGTWCNSPGEEAGEEQELKDPTAVS